MTIGRPITGSVRYATRERLWFARVTLNGDRVGIAMPDCPPCLLVPPEQMPEPGCVCGSCALARASAALTATKARDAGMVPEYSPEVSSEWFARYLALHAKLGNNTAQQRSDWRLYVAETAGTLPLSAWTPATVKKIRDLFATRRREGAFGAKRAFNLWSDLIKAPLSRAFSDDDPAYGSLRVGPASANPALGIKPPVNSDEREEDVRERQALAPSDFVKLVSCEALPIAWRREQALKAFAGMRPAEVYGLKWSDVRLDGEQAWIKVLRGRNMKTGAELPTKTKSGRRDVPVHDHLLPMLRAMRDEATDKSGFVIAIANERVRDVEKNVAMLRANLEAAGITAPELLAGNEGLMPFDDRSWRTTFASWAGKAGYDSVAIDKWLGHAAKSTAALHYRKDTPHFRDMMIRPPVEGVAAPFPPLPASLSGGEATKGPSGGQTPSGGQHGGESSGRSIAVESSGRSIPPGSVGQLVAPPIDSSPEKQADRAIVVDANRRDHDRVQVPSFAPDPFKNRSTPANQVAWSS